MMTANKEKIDNIGKRVQVNWKMTRKMIVQSILMSQDHSRAFHNHLINNHNQLIRLQIEWDSSTKTQIFLQIMIQMTANQAIHKEEKKSLLYKKRSLLMRILTRKWKWTFQISINMMMIITVTKVSMWLHHKRRQELGRHQLR